MELTKIQQRIIESIIEKEVYDVLTYIYKFLDYIPDNETKAMLTPEDLTRFSDKRSNLIILKDYELSYNAVQEYVTLIEKLKKEFLVIELDKGDEHYDFYNEKFLKFPIMLVERNGEIKQPHEIHELTYRYGVNYILPLPDLKDFKNRNYKTIDESKFESEMADRASAMKWTKAIALISIIGVIFSTLFNFFTNRNDRVVEIKSMPKTDTIKAYIIQSENIDTTVTH